MIRTITLVVALGALLTTAVVAWGPGVEIEDGPVEVFQYQSDPKVVFGYVYTVSNPNGNKVEVWGWRDPDGIPLRAESSGSYVLERWNGPLGMDEAQAKQWVCMMMGICGVPCQQLVRLEAVSREVQNWYRKNGHSFRIYAKGQGGYDVAVGYWTRRVNNDKTRVAEAIVLQSNYNYPIDFDCRLEPIGSEDTDPFATTDSMTSPVVKMYQTASEELGENLVTAVADYTRLVEPCPKAY